MCIKIYTDGGSRGNPGMAAIGVVVFKDDECIFEQSSYIGTATNNEAEYQGLLSALEWLKQHQDDFPADTPININLDSKLVVEQMNKNWKIKEVRMGKLAREGWDIIDSLPFSVSLKHVRRNENERADTLVNQALDAHQNT